MGICAHIIADSSAGLPAGLANEDQTGSQEAGPETSVANSIYPVPKLFECTREATFRAHPAHSTRFKLLDNENPIPTFAEIVHPAENYFSPKKMPNTPSVATKEIKP